MYGVKRFVFGDVYQPSVIIIIIKVFNFLTVSDGLFQVLLIVKSKYWLTGCIRLLSIEDIEKSI